jgi:copper chaperone
MMMIETQATLKIDGMSCNHCVRTVTSALDAVPGVHVQQVTIGAAQVSYDADQVTRQQLVEAVEEVGFEVVEA